MAYLAEHCEHLSGHIALKQRMISLVLASVRRLTM